MGKIIVSRIDWDADGYDISELNLPTEVELPSNIDTHDDDAIEGYLTDTYGFFVNSYSVPMTDDDIDGFGMYVNEVEGRVS